MEMDKKEEEKLKGRGTEVHVKDRGLVGGEEYTAEGKKDGRSGRVRRATFDDLKAIIDINDNVYEGFDYMPAFFYTFMHSKQHVIYVYEENGKLVSLVNYGFHPNSKNLVSPLSGRVHPSYQGRRLADLDKSPFVTYLLKEYPLLRSYIGDGMYTPNIAVKMKKWKPLYIWNILAYKLPDHQWLTRFTHLREMALGAGRPFSLSYTKGTEWLESSDQLVRFLSKHVGDLFPVGSTWMPTPANKSGIRRALSAANVYISLDPASTIDILNPVCFLETGHGLQRTRDRGQDGDITGISFSTEFPCKYGIRIDIFFYGDCEKSFLSHLYSQLHHYVSITSDDVKIAVLLHFPLTIDSKIVEERLKEEMGGRVYNDTFKVTQAVQYVAEFDRQAKL